MTTTTAPATLADITAVLDAAKISNGIETTPRRQFVQVYTLDPVRLCEVLKAAALDRIRVSPQGAPNIYNVERI